MICYHCSDVTGPQAILETATGRNFCSDGCLTATLQLEKQVLCVHPAESRFVQLVVVTGELFALDDYGDVWFFQVPQGQMLPEGHWQRISTKRVST